MRLLIVFPYAFGTGWTGATPRTMHVARGLSRLGWEVNLLRCKQPKEADFNPLIDAFPGSVVTAPFNGLYPAFFNRRGLRQVFDGWRRLLGFANNDEDYDPTRVIANRFLRMARNDPTFPQPDLIWGITVGALAGPLSAQLLSVHFHCPFVVEFRDPIPHPGRPPLTPQRRAVLESCLSACGLVVTTTEGISKKVTQEFPIAATKVRTIYSAYDGEVGSQPVRAMQQGPLVMVHAGVLYGGKERNASSLVRAIAEAAKMDASVRGRIQLRLIGAGAGGEEAARLARDLDIPWAVELLAQMPSQACLNEMDRANVLVVIKFDDADFDLQVPGKLFQYLGRGKPILCLMRETEAATIARRSGLGIVLANSDIAGISATIIEFCKHRDSLAARFRPDWEYIKGFSASSMAEELDRELTALVCARTDQLQATT